MQRAALSPDEAGAIEKDAGAVDDAGVGAVMVAEDAAVPGVEVTLETLGRQGGGESGDGAPLILVPQVGADGAAAQAEMLGRFGPDALTAPTPQAHPGRAQKLPVEAPHRGAVADLLHVRVRRHDPLCKHPYQG